MDEEFYAVIKLVSGEEILSVVLVDDSTDDTLLVLQNPIIIKMMNSSTGVYLKVKPWMELVEDDIYFIKLDKVLTMTETTNEKLIELYKNYLEDDDTGGTNTYSASSTSIDVYKPSGEVNVSEQKGYITSVEDARETLEKIFKLSKES
jgi:hypothetical protein|tara:strand:- start:2249 stop:2692 length:444 start_codon:yes stop_codon:yes gene_type:complete